MRESAQMSVGAEEFFFIEHLLQNTAKFRFIENRPSLRLAWPVFAGS
jgi:hypothetical protein